MTRVTNRGVSYYVNCAGIYPPLQVSREKSGSAELAPERSQDDKTILGRR